MVTERVRTGVRVEGIVQGVGFRPFVYSLAARLGLGGLVGNDVNGVFVEVEGTPAAVEQFLRFLERDAPPLARIDRVKTTALAPDGSRSFEIVASEPGGPRRALVSADSATCADCLRELADPADRRYGYPFINCTNCGPRFTIVRDVPYDRPRTTMASFRMCGQCAAEYHDPANRRFHAQPTCCPVCGPRLVLLDPDGAPWNRRMDDRAGPAPGAWAGTGADPAPGGDPVATAAALLRDGQILAVKGLGGYHLAVDAASEKAAAALRERKHREDKPFAVMAQDIAAARRLCDVNAAAAALLATPRRPIVLLPRRPRAARPMPAGAGAVRPGPAIAEAVAPGNRHLGIMLPYTPLHHLLLRAVDRPIVLTSGNISDEPIAYRDDDALARLGGIADAFLTHDRAIHIRTDDSVVREFRGREMLVRRSRGYVPEPVPVRVRFPRPVLACGAELKNTFCLAKGDHAFISHHIGDLENAETLRSFTEGIEHFRRLFDIDPRVVAYDLHPEYLSTKYALDLEGVDLEGVQHHHAHIASCLADNGENGPVIGVAFDGTGYGTDGTIWGGEFLVADLAHFRRAGHLAPVPMPGGVAAIRQPWRMTAAYLDAAYPGGPPPGLDVTQRNERMWANVITLARKGVSAPVTSSAGRLFDAVSALLGVRDTINYEGQAAVELEQLAAPSEAGAYQASIEPGALSELGPPSEPGTPTPSESGAAGERAPRERGAPGQPGSPSQSSSPGAPRAPFRVAGTDLVRQAAADLADGTDRGIIAARFHNGVARLIEEACVLIREREGLGTVALSGGVFQNLTLLHQAVARLEARGFRVLVHSRVPCNDGGISLGQAVVAASRDQSAEAYL